MSNEQITTEVTSEDLDELLEKLEKLQAKMDIPLDKFAIMLTIAAEMLCSSQGIEMSLIEKTEQAIN